MLEHFHYRNTLDDIIRHRKGEIKLGERFKFLEGYNLATVKRKHKKVKFALFGIPESIGILANQGRGGAEHAYQEFLFQFVNLQSNRFLEGSEILCLGQVETKDLQQRAAELSTKDGQYFTKLRSYCQELDQRVAPVVESVVKAGLVPVVIGGGPNNALPLLKGVYRGLNLSQGMGCVNLDTHAGFRPLEGRHSGNGFSYAFYQGYLRKYFALGLMEQTNSEAMLKNMDIEEGVEYQLYQPGLDPEVDHVVKTWTLPVGLEIGTSCGYRLDQMCNLIRKINKQIRPMYLHLTMGQFQDPANDAPIVGNALSALVLEFIKTYSD